MANVIDQLVGFFSAEAGLRRTRARMKAQTLQMNYDAASRGRRTNGWKAPAGSADRAGMASRTQLRNLSRDMIRNRAYAARACEVVSGAVVGTGVVYSVHGVTDVQKKAVEAILAEHLTTPKIDAYREHDLYGLQEIAMKAVFSDGEVLIRRRWRTGQYDPDLQLPFQMELLEVDYLDMSTFSNGQNEVSEGIEYGPTGRIVAYWLYQGHPGDMRYGTMKSTRVPASDIIHMRVSDRPGQARGIPWLAPVMMTLGEISDYQEAQILKQRMSSLMAGIISTEDGAQGPDIEDIEDLAPGALVKLPPGSTIDWTNPPQVDAYGEFVKIGVRGIAIGIGITYESLSGDLENVNYSSGRMGHMVMDRNVESWQSNLIISQMGDGLAVWIKEAWALNPKLPRIDFKLKWTAPRRPLIDPTKEIPALIAEVEGGLSSIQRQQRRLGYDPDVIRAERIEDMKKDSEAQLPPVGNTVAAALAGGANADQNGVGK